MRIRAASLNYRDLLVGRGIGRWAPPPGRILGSDGAGEVVAVGEGVAWPAIGQRVIGAFLPGWLDGPMTAAKMTGGLGGAVRDGVFADYVLLDAASTVAAPAHMTDAEAATLVCAGVTAWQALSRADSLHPDRSVLVQGTGGVSLMALQMAHAAGARVIATSSRNDKLRHAAELGAWAGVNYRTHENWDDEAIRLTGGVGVEHVVDVGGAATLERSVAAVAYEGTVSLVGLLGGARAGLDVVAVHLRGIRLQGIETGSRAMLDRLARWSEAVSLRPAIG
ncbi:MAG: NAD(P)-dependent alcohol dehydrogenase, partial [Gluconacetobacter diazotrophicus]|nr:NAD(P)-dependent alcohol dehydrogenase [Gluconacetobacter diazotrophicus]